MSGKSGAKIGTRIKKRACTEKEM